MYDEFRAMRNILQEMAWMRARGELESILQAYYLHRRKERQQREQVRNLIEELTAEMDKIFSDDISRCWTDSRSGLQPDAER